MDKPDGVSLIAAERKRQIEKEGWSLEHDAGHASGALVMAASCYLIPLSSRWAPPSRWPWSKEWWKPAQDHSTEGRVRELVKAGALIAAEIDRLTRKS